MTCTSNDANEWHVDPDDAGSITTADADDQRTLLVGSSHSSGNSSFASSDHSRGSTSKHSHSGKKPPSQDKTEPSTNHGDSPTPGKQTLPTSLQRASTPRIPQTRQTTDRLAKAKLEADTPVVTAPSLQDTQTPNSPTPMDTQKPPQAQPSSPSNPDQPGWTTVPGSKSKRKAN
jgi:hypothetical protein